MLLNGKQTERDQLDLYKIIQWWLTQKDTPIQDLLFDVQIFNSWVHLTTLGGKAAQNDIRR